MFLSKSLVFLLLFLGLHTPNLKSKNFEATVIGIKDGDTIEVLFEQRPLEIRLSDIDCPEKKQPFGAAAKKFTANFCYRKKVRIISNGKFDRYKRLIATVFVNNVSLNKQLVINGYAWHFKKYSSKREYALLENQARRRKVGLWSEKNPIAPWNWRKPRK